MKFELYQSAKDKQHYFRLIAENGEVIAQSEGYQNERDAADTVELIKQAAATATIEHA